MFAAIIGSLHSSTRYKSRTGVAESEVMAHDWMCAGGTLMSVACKGCHRNRGGMMIQLGGKGKAGSASKWR